MLFDERPREACINTESEQNTKHVICNLIRSGHKSDKARRNRSSPHEWDELKDIILVYFNFFDLRHSTFVRRFARSNASGTRTCEPPEVPGGLVGDDSEASWHAQGFRNVWVSSGRQVLHHPTWEVPVAPHVASRKTVRTRASEKKQV